MNSKIKFLSLFFLALPVLSGAAGDGIPVSFILFQTLNFGIFLGLIIFFIARKIPLLLKRKHQDFIEMTQKSKKLFEQTQKENEQIKQKLKTVENQMTQVESVAQKQIQTMQERVSTETKEIQINLRKEAQNILNRERIKLKQNLLVEVLEKMKHSCREEDSNSLRFLNKVQKRKAL